MGESTEAHSARKERRVAGPSDERPMSTRLLWRPVCTIITGS